MDLDSIFNPVWSNTGASKALQSPQVSAAEGHRTEVDLMFKTLKTLRNDAAFGSVIWEKVN